MALSSQQGSTFKVHLDIVGFEQVQDVSCVFDLGKLEFAEIPGGGFHLSDIEMVL